IIEIARLVPGTVSKGHHFLVRNLLQRVGLHNSALGQVRELVVGPQDGPGLDWKHKLLADRYIHLYGAASGQWTDVPHIECVAVGVCVAVLAVKCEFDSGVRAHGSVDRVQPKAEILKRRSLQYGKIQTSRKTIVAEVAALERRP